MTFDDLTKREKQHLVTADDSITHCYCLELDFFSQLEDSLCKTFVRVHIKSQPTYRVLHTSPVARGHCISTQQRHTSNDHQANLRSFAIQIVAVSCVVSVNALINKFMDFMARTFEKHHSMDVEETSVFVRMVSQYTPSLIGFSLSPRILIHTLDLPEVFEYRGIVHYDQQRHCVETYWGYGYGKA